MTSSIYPFSLIHLLNLQLITMATATNPLFTKYSPQTQLTLDSGMKAAEAASVVFPPAYVGWLVLRGGPRSVRSLMAFSTASVVIGGAVGAGVGYMRFKSESEEGIAGRINRLVRLGMTMLME